MKALFGGKKKAAQGSDEGPRNMSAEDLALLLGNVTEASLPPAEPPRKAPARAPLRRGPSNVPAVKAAAKSPARASSFNRGTSFNNNPHKSPPPSEALSVPGGDRKRRLSVTSLGSPTANSAGLKKSPSDRSVGSDGLSVSGGRSGRRGSISPAGRSTQNSSSSPRSRSKSPIPSPASKAAARRGRSRDRSPGKARRGRSGSRSASPSRLNDSVSSAAALADEGANGAPAEGGENQDNGDVAVVNGSPNGSPKKSPLAKTNGAKKKSPIARSQSKLSMMTHEEHRPHAQIAEMRRKMGADAMSKARVTPLLALQRKESMSSSPGASPANTARQALVGIRVPHANSVPAGASPDGMDAKPSRRIASMPATGSTPLTTVRQRLSLTATAKSPPKQKKEMTRSESPVKTRKKAASPPPARPHVIILPDFGCSPVRQCNWYASVEAELTAAGIDVTLEDMPSPDDASSSVWLTYIKDHMYCSSHSIVIGHSAGALAAMRLMEQHTLKGVVLIAAAHTDLGDAARSNSGYCNRPWQWQSMQRNAGWIVQYASAEDPFVPAAEATYVHEALRSQLVNVKSGGHFSSLSFPRLVTLIKSKLAEASP